MAAKSLAISITSKAHRGFLSPAPIARLAYNRTMTTEENDILVEEKGKVGIITLNRPKALNSLNLSMVTKLYPLLKKWETDRDLVIIKGAGEKAFCAGGDVKAVVQAGMKGERLGHEFFKNEYMTNGLIGSYKKPYVALIDGITMGGGVGLSVHGKYRVATERTLFAMPETQIGLFPDVGGSYFLPRLPGKLGLYLALTGVRLNGFDVFKAGIATHYTSTNNLKDLEAALVECKNEKQVSDILAQFHQNLPQDFSLKSYLDQINKCFAPYKLEQIYDELEKDNTKWSKDTVRLLNKMSPTSMKVTIKQLQSGERMTLQECLTMEYRVAVGCLNSKKDFFEGVRALLIDKDQNPKWDPPTPTAVTEELVNSFFQQLPEGEELRHKL